MLAAGRREPRRSEPECHGRAAGEALSPERRREPRGDAEALAGDGRLGGAGSGPGAPDRFLNFAAFAVEVLSDGAYLITKEGIIVYVNDAACQMMGYTREEMVGMTMVQVNPTIDRELWDAIWTVTEREKKQTIETEHLTKDGHRVPLDVLADYRRLRRRRVQLRVHARHHRAARDRATAPPVPEDGGLAVGGRR
ncbi:MAG TPA: PAS domain-containing protein, partial [Polyangiaceae bacterium]|nr:PAS domain-containing protein [Polyangiaceae bacterium]